MSCYLFFVAAKLSLSQVALFSDRLERADSTAPTTPARTANQQPVLMMKMTVLKPMLRSGLGALYLVGALAVVLMLVTYPIFDLDLFWHLANGRAMVESGRILNSEAFSYTHFGEQFVNHAWLAEVLLYRAWATWGSIGLYVVKWTSVLLTAWLLWLTVRRTGLVAPSALALVPLMVLAGLDRYHVRPELFSIMGVSLLVATLESERAGRSHQRVLWLVPAVFAVWDWVHGAIIGWAYLLVFVGAENMRRPKGQVKASARRRRLNICLGLTFLVGALNPYGFRTYEHFLVLAGELKGADRILELQPLWDQPGNHISFAVLLLVALVLATADRRRTDLTDGLLAAFFALAALRYGRLVAVASIVVGIVVAKSLARAPHGDGRVQVLGRWAIAVIWVTLLIGGVNTKFGDRFYIPRADESYRLPREERAGFGLDELRTPAAAVRFVQTVGLSGNYYNNGNLGGYLAYHLAPQQRIFQYNMPPIFGDTTRFVRDPMELTRWNITYAFAGTNRELTTLFPAKEWAWVFSDYVCTVVVRRTADHADLIRRYELQCFSPEQPLKIYRALAANPSRRARLAFEMGVYLTHAEDARIAARWTSLLEQYPTLKADPDVAEILAAASDRNHLVRPAVATRKAGVIVTP